MCHLNWINQTDLSPFICSLLLNFHTSVSEGLIAICCVCVQVVNVKTTSIACRNINFCDCMACVIYCIHMKLSTIIALTRISQTSACHSPSCERLAFHIIFRRSYRFFCIVSFCTQKNYQLRVCAILAKISVQS